MPYKDLKIEGKFTFPQHSFFALTHLVLKFLVNNLINRLDKLVTRIHIPI